MKIKLFIISVSIALSSNLFADVPEFTCLQSSDTKVFAGVRLLEKGAVPDTYLLQVDSTNMTSSKIPLPDNLSGREVKALIPTKGPEVLVLTQWSMEQGDDPQLHSYHPDKKEWKKITEFSCPTFNSLKGDASQLVVNCLIVNKKGKQVPNPVKIKISDFKLDEKFDFKLPQRKIEKNDLVAELQGDSLEWKELKVVYKKTEKKFTP